VIVLAGRAFLVGYWPEHHRRQALEGQITGLGLQLAEAPAVRATGVSGLPGVGFEEPVRFRGGAFGIAFNGDEDEVGVVSLHAKPPLPIPDRASK
jgi:hypothetical protein